MNNNLNNSLKIVTEWITQYQNEVKNYPVMSPLKFGDILEQLPKEPKESPEQFETIFNDFLSVIVPGITHWQHPKFFGYFPSNSSIPSLLAEMLTATLGIQAMSWITSPAATELEIRVMEWLRDLFSLPKSFHGVIQDSASSSSMIAVTAAREKATKYHTNNVGLANHTLVAYCSTETHSSIEKAIKIIGIGNNNLRKIPVNQDQQMNTDALQRCIEEDLQNGLTPFFIAGTFGTTGSTAIDPLKAIARISKKYDLWFHIDAAYAGTALLLPEIRLLAEGIEEADSIVINPHKWLFTTFDCSALFIRNKDLLLKTFSILPEYLKDHNLQDVVNFRDWGLGLGRRFRSLKLWFVIRWYGKLGLQSLIRSHIELGSKFEQLIKKDGRFEIAAKRQFNLVCFRLKATDEENIKLLNTINRSGKMFLTHTRLNGSIVLRAVLAQTNLTEDHVIEAWKEIQEMSCQ